MTPALFPDAEYRARLAQVQRRMVEADLAVLLLSTEADVRYFSGFLTRFWESPTRPWYLIVPADGNPVAVIPFIGRALMAATWITDIRCWRAPDLHDDGVSLLADTLIDLTRDGDRIAVPAGLGTHLRIPLDDWTRLQGKVPDRRFVGDAGVMRAQRLVKSEAEIACIAAACAIADRVFARVPEIAAPGTPLSTLFRRFQILCLEEGADWVPYLAGGAGPGGYVDVISPADDRLLARGDVLMLDTGLMRAGYFCDFDRNFSIGPACPGITAGHARLVDAVAAGFDAARPGATAADLFRAMDGCLATGHMVTETGRLGHGLGMQLTEPPSLIPEDDTVLAPGMALTLEPGLALKDGKILVHEENIVIRESGAQWLSTPAAAQIVELAA